MKDSNDSPKDKIVPVDYAQQAMMDGLDAVRRPDAYAVMLLDMSASHAFRARNQQQYDIALTDLHLIIRAVARALETDSVLNSIVHRNKIIHPATVDIGVSVATRSSVAPVVVIPDAPSKSLTQIKDELTTKAAHAKQQEQEYFSKLNQYARWLPSRALRRAIVRTALRRHQVRRSMLGTVQITTLDLSDLDFYLPNHLGTTMLVSVGGVKKRPVVVDDRIEIRPTAYVAFQVDQRVVNAVSALRVFRRFRRWMEHPERLDEDS